MAIEPVPENAEWLRENSSRNSSQWSVLEYALSDGDGEAKINIPDSRGSEVLSEEGDISVTTRRPDTLIQTENIPAPDIVKIDVEGGEMDVFRGFGSCLDDIRVIYCEIYPDELPNFESSAEEVRPFLKGQGFNIDKINTDRLQYHRRAVKNRNQSPRS